MKDFLKKNILSFVLIAICLFVSFKNYTPGTFLTGWDTLHPEFNFKLYWSRIIDSAWQEHQGLGAVASQAHASEIPRILLLQAMSFVFAIDKLRYFYAFLMLVVGPLGIYFFLSQIFLKRFSERTQQLGGFIGGLFYLFNLGTLQHFYVPLEMFLTHYGLLGWVFLYVSKFYESGRKKDFALFLLASFFIVPQAHTPTLFYAYFGALALFVGTLVALDRFTRESRKKLTAVLVATLLLNAFWFLPHLYFVFNHASEVGKSKIHYLFSEEAFLQNQEFGQIQDVSILKNFLFNWGEHTGNGRFGDLLDEWILHLENKNVLYLGYAFFGVVVLGLIAAFLQRNRYAFAIFSVMLFGLFFLLNNNPPFGPIFKYLQENFTLFKEVFRFPFTKFSILLMFAYASFFAYAITLLLETIQRLPSRVAMPIVAIVYSMFVLSLIYYAKPMLHGYLISPSMRVKIPQRYFELFSYLEQHKDYGRVANLPIETFWGWVYHNWDSQWEIGYQGAGFLWFGIKQPLMDREFDRWDILNEQYYREMSVAVYSEDPVLFKQVLDKYKIRWVLLDESVMAPGADEKALFYGQTRALLDGNLVLDKDFGDGLKLYKYALGPASSTEILNKFVYSNDSLFKEYDDPIYAQYKDYVQSGESNYPYLGITNYTENLKSDVVSSDDSYLYLANKTSETVDKEDQVQLSFAIVAGQNNNVVLKTQAVQGGVIEPVSDISIPVDSSDYTLVINGVLPITFNVNQLEQSYTLTTKVSDLVELSLYKLNSVLSNVSDYASLVERCSGVEGGSTYGIEYEKTGFKLLAKDVASCVTIKLDALTIARPEVLVVKTDVIATDALPGICIFDEESGLCQNRPIESGTVTALLNPKPYLLRFLAYSTGTEGSASFSNIRLLSGTSTRAGEIRLVKSTKPLVGEYLTFAKDSAFSGDAVNLISDPRLCSGERNFDKSSVLRGKDYTTYESHGDSLCDSYQFPFAEHNSGYVLEITSRNRAGMPLRVCLTNEYSKRCDVYLSMGTNKDFETSYYMVPPMGEGKGYTVNLSNLVFGQGSSVNDLQYIALTPVPYNFFRSLHKEPIASNGEQLLVLNQAYESGWLALCGYKLCDAKHVMVNNWSNGWLFNSAVPADAKPFFVPQLLQYLGFMLLPLAFLRLVAK